MSPHLQSIVDMTIDMCSIASVSDDIYQLDQIIQHIYDYFVDTNGVYIYRYSCNDKPSIVIQNFDGKHADVMMNGHIDVVAPSSNNQRSPYIQDGRIYARGAGDMKAGVAICMYIMKQILENPINRKVSCVFTSDEEIGGFDGVQYVISQGHSADVVLIPDGGASDQVVFGEKGFIFAKIDVMGKGGHSSAPRSCDNAINKVISLYQELKTKIETPDQLVGPDRWSTTAEMTMISSGQSINTIPDIASICINIRYTQDYTDTSLQFILDQVCTKYDAHITYQMGGDVVFLDSQNKIVKQYISTVDHILGYSSTRLYAHGASDGRWFAKLGVPVIIHRPDCANIHTLDERVDISAMDHIYHIYYDFICG